MGIEYAADVPVIVIKTGIFSPRGACRPDAVQQTGLYIEIKILDFSIRECPAEMVIEMRFGFKSFKPDILVGNPLLFRLFISHSP
jgi:hypothetical protein